MVVILSDILEVSIKDELIDNTVYRKQMSSSLALLLEALKSVCKALVSVYTKWFYETLIISKSLKAAQLMQNVFQNRRRRMGWSENLLSTSIVCMKCFLCLF